ncbi:hypothetical protein ACP70R_025217 [Stipagrostis hirtigluma subsp. patula]
MEAAPSAKPRRESPPIPPNYVSLRQLQELRIKEKEQQEKRRREEEEAAAVAAKRAEEAAAAAKREAALKAESEGRTARPVASGGAKERRHCWQGQGKQWVALSHRPPPPAPARGGGAAGKREGPIGGGRGTKGLAEAETAAAASSSHGRGKAKGKDAARVSAVASAETRGVDEPGKPAEAAGGSSHGGKPDNKGVEKTLVDQNVGSGSSGGPMEPAEAAGASSSGRTRPGWNRKSKKGRGGRGAGPNTGTAPAKTPVVESNNTGKPKTPGDASPSSDYSDVKKAAPPPAPSMKNVAPSPAPISDSSGVHKAAPAPEPPIAAAEGSSNPTSGSERDPRVAGSFRYAGRRPTGGHGNGAAGRRGNGAAGVWVPKGGDGGRPI